MKRCPRNSGEYKNVDQLRDTAMVAGSPETVGIKWSTLKFKK